MMQTENISLNSSNAVDIASQADLDNWKAMRPKKKYCKKHVSFICEECKQLKTLMLTSITVYPILCRSCRLRHRYDDPHYIEKMKRTNMERYGVEYNSQTQAWRDSLKQTSLRKYGVEHFVQYDAIKEKIRNTTLKHFDGIGFASEELRDKQRATMVAKYNAYHNMVSPDLKQQFFASLMAKYGGIGNAVPSIAQKQQNTLFDRYGSNCVSDVACQRGSFYKKYKYDRKWFDSLPEIQFYMELKQNEIQFEYHPKTHFVYYCDGKKHYYYPDFKVADEYIELKGRHFFPQCVDTVVNYNDPNLKMINPYDRRQDDIAQAKLECMKQHNVKIIIVDSIKQRKKFIEDNHIVEHSCKNSNE